MLHWYFLSPECINLCSDKAVRINVFVQTSHWCFYFCELVCSVLLKQVKEREQSDSELNYLYILHASQDNSLLRECHYSLLSSNVTGTNKSGQL